MTLKKVKSFKEFKKKLLADKVLQDEFKKDPVKAIKQIEKRTGPLSTDAWIYRIVVIGLSITVLSLVIGVMILVCLEKITDDKSVPTILTAIGSAAIGALAGLLVPPANNENSTG